MLCFNVIIKNAVSVNEEKFVKLRLVISAKRVCQSVFAPLTTRREMSDDGQNAVLFKSANWE